MINKIVLIPNASPKNIGDLAILMAQIEILTKKKSKIIIHTGQKNPSVDLSKFDCKYSLYEWVYQSKNNPVYFLYRGFQVILALILIQLHISYQFINKDLALILNDYKNADIILFTGGGYLRSTKGIKQFLNLLLITIQLNLALLSKAKKLMAPISFGPIESKAQEKWIVKCLSKFESIFVRETISYEKLQTYGLKNVTLFPDMAFFTSSKKRLKKNNVIGFTIRPWFSKMRNKEMVAIYTQALKNFYLKTKMIIQPIIQVSAPGVIIEDDGPLTQEVYCQLQTMKIPVRTPISLDTLDTAKQVYGSLSFLLAMRMHSAILAATQGTPFVCIGYEHKTEGIMRELNLSEYVSSYNSLTKKGLDVLLAKGYSNRTDIRDRMIRRLNELRRSQDQGLKLLDP